MSWWYGFHETPELVIPYTRREGPYAGPAKPWQKFPPPLPPAAAGLEVLRGLGCVARDAQRLEIGWVQASAAVSKGHYVVDDIRRAAVSGALAATAQRLTV